MSALFYYIRRMLKSLILIPVLLLSLSTEAQSLVDALKKKYFGVYSGEIPAYEYNTGNAVIDVAPTHILIELNADNVIMEIGKSKKTGSYQVLFKADGYYVLEASFPDELQAERIVVYENKSLMREGLFPQANAKLEKLGKKELRSIERL